KLAAWAHATGAPSVPDQKLDTLTVKMRTPSFLAGLVLLLVASACSRGEIAATTTTTAVPLVAADCGTQVPRSLLSSWSLSAEAEPTGIVASRAFPGTVWVLTELGRDVELVAHTTSGQATAGLLLPSRTVEVGDLALGPGPDPGRDYLYVAGIDNPQASGSRNLNILRLAEPDPSVSGPASTEALEFQTPTGRVRDVRALFLDPDTGDLYLVIRDEERSLLYVAEAPLNPTGVQDLRQVAVISPALASRVTGADISPAGDAIAIRTDTSVLLWSRSPGQSIGEAIVAGPCITELPDDDHFGRFAFTGEANQFYTLTLGSKPKLYEHRPPLDPSLAVAELAVPPEAGNLTPLVKIDQPASPRTWQVGDTITFEASAEDDQDIDGDRFAWEFFITHCPPDGACTSRPIAEYAGSSAEVLVPPVGLTLPFDLQVMVTYTDSGGAAGQDSLDLLLETSTILLTSTPPGAVVTIGGEQIITPATREVALGDIVEVSVDQSQTVEGVVYGFAGWSSDEGRVHQFEAGEEQLALALELVTASSVGPPTVEIRTPASGSTVSGPVVTISGIASSGIGVDRVKLYVRNLGTGEYWNGSRWVDRWSWFAPMGLESWTYEITLGDGSYETIAWAWDAVDRDSPYELQTFTVR
ncbi:MAG: Ig-like domain-containing protein, partial [Acidimicrobiia bacterium]|nr:Ig-like domain-containing protein [Acidimicrobiia bacterium]